MTAGGPFRIACIALATLGIAAILRASSKAADHFDCSIADGDCPAVPKGMERGISKELTGGGQATADASLTHNNHGRTHDGDDR